VEVTTMPAPTTPDEMYAEFAKAYHARDLDAIMSLYEPDAILMPEPGTLARGADAIREAQTGLLAITGTMEVGAKTTLTSGDLAISRCSWRLTGAGPDGSPVDIAGDSTEVLRRQADGTWRLVFDLPWWLQAAPRSG
jgi:uncharacterized protein (TIGR02246 family)